MKSICFLLGGFQGNGGIGRVTSTLANRLCENESYRIYTVTYYQSDAPMLYTVDDKVGKFNLFDDAISMTKAILNHHAISKLNRIISDNHIDIIIACGVIFFPLAIMASKRTSARCFCWEHINPSISDDYRFQGIARKFGVRYADKLIVLTLATEKYYLSKLKAKPDRLVQIYNPIEHVNDKEYNAKSKKILSVGRLCAQKNFDQLISIAAKVMHSHPDWTWDIFGEGEEHLALANKINEYNLSQQVKLMGQVNDLYERYTEYSFLVMTSKYEGFPMTLIEGMAFSLPLVSFNVPTGPNEIIINGTNGYLVDPFEENQMVTKINELIENVNIREQFSKENRKKAFLFDIDNIIRKWEEIL